MKKSMLGIDIGTGAIKLVTNDQCVVIDTPENVFENDHFIAFDGMSEVYTMAEKGETGVSLSDAMNKSKYLPQVLREMSGVGEKSGELVATLKTIGDYYTNETDFAMKSALDKLEPAMLVLLALFVGFIVVAIYLPMFTMYSLM